MDTVQQIVDHTVGGIAFRLGGEVGDEAVPQDRMGQSADVIGGYMIASVQSSPSFSAED